MTFAIARNNASTKRKTGRGRESCHRGASRLHGERLQSKNAESPHGQFRAFWSSRLRVPELPAPVPTTSASRHPRKSESQEPISSSPVVPPPSRTNTARISVGSSSHFRSGTSGPALSDTSSSECTRQVHPWNGTSGGASFRYRTGSPVLSETFRPRAEIMLHGKEEDCKSNILISTFYPQNAEICQRSLPVVSVAPQSRHRDN